MDIMHILMMIGTSIIAGIVLTLVVQYYFLVRYFHNRPEAEEPRRNVQEEYALPEEIKQKLENNEMTSASLPVSLMFQFLFHELRHSEGIKRWLHKKLSLEFDELLTKTTIGKFFEAVTIRDMHLGTQFPDIEDISLDGIKLDAAEGHIDTLDMSIKLNYTGNFLLSVDARMKFGKTAYLSIKVKHVNGVGRLQFARLPYTHWSFSFFSEPQIELAVESHFQGRQLQSNITNLIIYQIKKSIRRKHTLPNYKIRYKPFFAKTDPGQQDDGELQVRVHGQLAVACMEMSRLAVPSDVTAVYCTLAVDPAPFVCVYARDNAVWLMLEVTLTRLRQQQLGVIFKQAGSGVVSVESVTPHTPAHRAGLQHADVVVAIENRRVTSVSQLGKAIKAIAALTISMKIERATTRHALRHPVKADAPPTMSALGAEDGDTDTDNSFVLVERDETERRSLSLKKAPTIVTSSANGSGGVDQVSKIAQTLGNFALRKRKSAAEASKSTASTLSCPSTPQHIPAKASGFLHAKKHSISELPEITRTDTDADVEDDDEHVIDVQRSRDLQVAAMMHVGDEFVFQLKDTARYLNVNVWGVSAQRDSLLGYTNIPLNEVLASCYNSLLGNFTQTYSFLPPNGSSASSQNHPLTSHSGFESVFCYGDVLLSFVWHRCDPGMDVGVADRPKVAVFNREEVKQSASGSTKHDFVRTHFHRSIHCDFCSKKIWLKDAVQCRECGMCCHKKCVSKCQGSTDCASLKDAAAEQAEAGGGESAGRLADMHLGETPPDDEQTPIKRVSSVHNLSIPGAPMSSAQSRSLPPTPQRTPTRKHSLVALNPFALCPAALDDIAGGASEAHDAISKLLEHMLACAADESLMETARESGRQMYATMVAEEKIAKINAMMIELKKMFDIVTTEHAELIRRHNHEDVDVERARIAFLLGQVDAKIHGLSVLMLHYCSGLQQS